MLELIESKSIIYILIVKVCTFLQNYVNVGKLLNNWRLLIVIIKEIISYF